MEFGILGPLTITRDGHDVPPPANKPRALLALLLMHRGAAVPLERLVDELWGERPPATAGKSVQVYVSQLRKLLGEGVLETRGRGYALLVEPDQVDAHRFERLLEEGAGLLAGGRAQEAAAALTEALGLWRGPSLADFSYEPWAATEIARLEDLHLAALEERIEADLALGHHGTLIAELHGLVQRHPTRERPCGQLMLALYRSGRQTEALEVYRERRRWMVDELGIEPGSALRELESQILCQDPLLGAPARPGTRGDPPAGAWRRRRVAALAGAALLLVAAGVAAAGFGAGGEDRPDTVSVRPVDDPGCSPLGYRPGSRPTVLIVADQELVGPTASLGGQISAAVEFTLRENRFSAGRHTVAYQACNSGSAKSCDKTARRYTDHAGLLGLIGPTLSRCAHGLIPVVNRGKLGPLAVVSSSNTDVGLTRAYAEEPPDIERLYPTGVRNYVRVLAADDFQVAANAMLAQRLGVRRAFVLVDEERTPNLGEAFISAAGRLGLQVVGYAELERTAPPVVARRIRRSNADGVFIGGILNEYTAGLIRALRAASGPDLHILTPDGFSIPEVGQQLGAAGEGVTISVPGVDARALTGKRRALVDRLREAIGDPHPYAVSAAQATQLLLDAIKRSDGTRRSVVTELFRSQVHDGLLGEFDVMPSGDITANQVTIYRIQDGEQRVERVLTPPLSLVD